VVVTLTTVEAVANCKVVVSVMGTDERTSASCEAGLKLAAEMVRWYGFSGRLVN
jgi:hypothetical protein